MIYIATFYSHFGAVRFKKDCKKDNISAEAMPVPRDLSSSCGTCVKFETDQAIDTFTWSQEVEQVVEITESGYKLHYHVELSD